MKEILVVGGSDFIGAALSKHLINCGYNIDIMTLEKRQIDYKGYRNNIVCNRNDREQTKSKLAGKKYEFVFDMTAYSKEEIKNILDFIDINSLKKYVVLSSGAVYKDTSKRPNEDWEKGENKNWGRYGIDKKEAEDYIMNSNIPYVIVRPTYIYGENNNLYREYYFFDSILSGNPIPVPDGKDVVTNFIYIDDLVRVLESLIYKPNVREAYNVTNPQAISWRELIYTCGDVIGKTPIIKLVDINKIKCEDVDYFPFKNIDFTLEIDKLIEHGLYIPNIFLREGLEKTYEWYKKNKPKIENNPMRKVEEILNIS